MLQDRGVGYVPTYRPPGRLAGGDRDRKACLCSSPRGGLDDPVSSRQSHL